ncbi:MAG: helix-turn-helix transcriptional regulator [Gammaproteobacteria bacterium]|jgi:transcriptional regulator with XRE-family HTH domain
MSAKKSASPVGKTERNPLYLKIGKRIRQARLMAKETNSRELSQRLGWSAGRIHNYETGLSTPGVEETLQFCEALGIDPAWLTYGTGAPRPADLHSSRYRNFIHALDQAEREGILPEYLDAIRLPVERMQKFRRNPYVKIPDVMARRCEKFLGKRRGWIDESHDEIQTRSYLDQEMQDLLALYARLSPQERKKFFAIGEIMVG